MRDHFVTTDGMSAGSTTVAPCARRIETASSMTVFCAGLRPPLEPRASVAAIAS